MDDPLPPTEGLPQNTTLLSAPESVRLFSTLFYTKVVIVGVDRPWYRLRYTHRALAFHCNGLPSPISDIAQSTVPGRSTCLILPVIVGFHYFRTSGSSHVCLNFNFRDPRAVSSLEWRSPRYRRSCHGTPGVERPDRALSNAARHPAVQIRPGR